MNPDQTAPKGLLIQHFSANIFDPANFACLLRLLNIPKCIHYVKLLLIMEANTMSPDQTAPNGAI